MLIAIKGYYEDGKITLLEDVPVNVKPDVVVIFETDSTSVSEDFDNPLKDLQ